jgi:hypothetical protein
MRLGAADLLEASMRASTAMCSWESSSAGEVQRGGSGHRFAVSVRPGLTYGCRVHLFDKPAAVAGSPRKVSGAGNEASA